MVGQRIKDKERTVDIATNEEVSFDSLFLSLDVLNGLKDAGFERPSPIQLQAIPLAKCGADLICQAKSGTGKTCVFVVTALQSVNTSIQSLQVLVLAPTREIAYQIHDVIVSIGNKMVNLECKLFIGGLSVRDDIANLKTCHIAVGTPGRIKSLIEEKHLMTDSIRLFVLDEADKLLEEGSFQEQINWIFSTLPKHKQMLALSATYPESLAKFLNNYMQEPIHVRINVEDLVLKGVKQFFTSVDYHPLANIVFKAKFKSLLRIIKHVPFQQCMVFSNFQSRASHLCKILTREGWPCTFIAGAQPQAVRLKAMSDLKNNVCRILITTDLSARGIDCEKVSLVINLDLPWDIETYLHRVGRAGRFGAHALAISIVSGDEECVKLAAISDAINGHIFQLPEELTEVEKVNETTPSIKDFVENVELIEKQDEKILSECDRAAIMAELKNSVIENDMNETSVVSSGSSEDNCKKANCFYGMEWMGANYIHNNQFVGGENINSQSDSKDEINNQSECKDDINSQSDCKSEVNSQSNWKEKVDNQLECKDDINSQSECIDDINIQSDSKDEIKNQSDWKEKIDSQSPRIETNESINNAKYESPDNVTVNDHEKEAGILNCNALGYELELIQDGVVRTDYTKKPLNKTKFSSEKHFNPMAVHLPLLSTEQEAIRGKDISGVDLALSTHLSGGAHLQNGMSFDSGAASQNVTSDVRDQNSDDVTSDFSVETLSDEESDNYTSKCSEKTSSDAMTSLFEKSDGYTSDDSRTTECSESDHDVTQRKTVSSVRPWNQMYFVECLGKEYLKHISLMKRMGMFS